MSSFHIFILKMLGLPVLLGAVSLSQVRTSKPSVSFVADIDDYDYGMGLSDFKANPPKDVVYDHMPKAGGTFLIRLLRSSVGGEHFSFESEFHNLTRDDIHHKFVIGSVRNPCDYYLSLWAYGAEHGGAMMSHIPAERRWVYETKSKLKDSNADKNRFHRWARLINMEGKPGVMSVRFAQSYAKLDTVIRASKPPLTLEPRELDAVARALSTPAFMDRVDCWIKADDMRASSIACLHELHKKTGIKVDWKAYEQAYEESKTLSSAHTNCQAYFSPELEQFIRKREAPIFKYFGYDKCCA